MRRQPTWFRFWRLGLWRIVPALVGTCLVAAALRGGGPLKPAVPAAVADPAGEEDPGEPAEPRPEAPAPGGRAEQTGESQRVRLSAKPQGAVPILMYHVIAPGPNNLYVPPEELEAHLIYLAKQGYHGITLQRLYDHFNEGAPLPERPVVLTFDDGYADFDTAALPLLQKHGFTATLFVITGYVGDPGYITWEQAQAIVEAGIEIGSHTVSHPDLRTAGEKGLQRELGESRQTLEERLGVRADFFAYPAGRYNEKSLAVVRQHYRGAVTTASGMATPCQDPMLWQRVRINQRLTGEGLGQLLHYWEEQARKANCQPPRRPPLVADLGPLP